MKKLIPLIVAVLVLVLLPSCSNRDYESNIRLRPKDPMANYGQNILYSRGKYYVRLGNHTYISDPNTGRFAKTERDMITGPFCVDGDTLYSLQGKPLKGNVKFSCTVNAFSLSSGTTTIPYRYESQNMPYDSQISINEGKLFGIDSLISIFDGNHFDRPSYENMRFVAKNSELLIYQQDSLLYVAMIDEGYCQSAFDLANNRNINYCNANILTYDQNTQTGYMVYDNAIYQIAHSEITPVASLGEELWSTLSGYYVDRDVLYLTVRTQNKDAENRDTCYKFHTSDNMMNTVYKTTSKNEAVVFIDSGYLYVYKDQSIRRLSLTDKQETGRLKVFGESSSAHAPLYYLETAGHYLYGWNGQSEKVIDLSAMQEVKMPE